MDSPLANFDDLIRCVHGGKVRFSGCNARKQRAKFEELSSDPNQQRRLRSGWERWEAIKESCMCHTVDGVIRRLYEFFQCFEGQSDTQQYLQDLDCLLERRGTDFNHRVTSIRRILDRVSPDQNNMVGELVNQIEQSSRPTIFWFLIKTPDADDSKITGAYKQFAFSKTTTKLVAPLFLWMWRMIEKIVPHDRLRLLQIVYEVVTCTYNQKTVTHLVPMKLLKDSKRVAKELKRVIGMRHFVTDVSKFKFPEQIDKILSAEIAELRRQQEENVRRIKIEGGGPPPSSSRNEQMMAVDDDDRYCSDEEEFRMRQQQPSFYHPPNQYQQYDVDNIHSQQFIEDKYSWNEVPDLDENTMHAGPPPHVEYAFQEFGNVPYMLERDERVEVMLPPKKDEHFDANDPLQFADEEEKQPLVTGVPVGHVFGTPVSHEDGLDRSFRGNFFIPHFTPPPFVPVSAPLDCSDPPMDYDVEMEEQHGGEMRRNPVALGRQYPMTNRRMKIPWDEANPMGGASAIGSFDGWETNAFTLPPQPPPVQPQEDLSHRMNTFGSCSQAHVDGGMVSGQQPPFGDMQNIPPPVVTPLNFEDFPTYTGWTVNTRVNDRVPKPPMDCPRGAQTGNGFDWGQDGRFGDFDGVYDSGRALGGNLGQDTGDRGPFGGQDAGNATGLSFGFGDDANTHDFHMNGFPSDDGRFSGRLSGDPIYSEPPRFSFQMVTSAPMNPFALSNQFSFGSGFADRGCYDDKFGSNKMESSQMDMDFQNRPLEVDEPPPELGYQFGHAEQNGSPFLLRSGHTIASASGGSRQNDPFDLNQNQPNYSGDSQTFM